MSEKGGIFARLSTCLESSLPSPRPLEFPFRIDITVEFLGRLERRSGSSFLPRHFRAVPTTRTSSFIRPDRVRSIAYRVSYVHAHTEYPGIHDVTNKSSGRKNTQGVSQNVLIFSRVSIRFFSF